jgi:hypothetical protein
MKKQSKSSTRDEKTSNVTVQGKSCNLCVYRPSGCRGKDPYNCRVYYTQEELDSDMGHAKRTPRDKCL